MKLIFKVLILSIIVQSCNSQSDFDLTQIKLQKDKVGDLITPDIKRATYPIGESDLEYLDTKNPKFLTFNGANLRGQQNPDSNKQGLNGISIYYNKKDSIIYRYGVHIFSEIEATNLLNTLKEKLGEPNFTSYMRPDDKINNKIRGLLWEKKQNRELYLLEYSLEETIKAELIVLHNSENIVKQNITSSFSYWEDYLFERKQKNDDEYSYQDFLKEKNKNNPDNFYNQYTK